MLCYVNTVIPHRPRPDVAVNANGIESIVIEVKTKSEKYFIVFMYRAPSAPLCHLINAIEEIYDACLRESTTVYLIGDVNVELLKPTHALSSILDLYSIKNVIQGPTCFKNVLNPTLLDIILTNKPLRVANVLNVSAGISDFHNLVCAATGLHKPDEVARQITYRTFKNFDEALYIKDLESAPLHVSGIFDDVDDQLWFHNALLTDIIDSHAPQKSCVIKKQQVPYMNGQLRKAINVKGMLLYAVFLIFLKRSPKITMFLCSSETSIKIVVFVSLITCFYNKLNNMLYLHGSQRYS